MEVEKINVNFSGYALAEILNRANYSKKTEEGLLFGDSQSEAVESISDTTQDGICKTTNIVVQDSTQCKHRFSFYDQLGKICEDKFTSIDKAREKQCIGFYLIRRNLKFALSLREKTIIQNLLKSPVFHHKWLLFFIMEPSYERKKATFDVNYRSYVCELRDNGTTFTPIKSEIIDLGENFQSTYKHKSLLVSKKTDRSTKMMNMLQDYTEDKFLTDTGSVGIADNSYSMFYKTLLLMTNLQEELISCNQEIEKYKDEIDMLEQCREMDSMDTSS